MNGVLGHVCAHVVILSLLVSDYTVPYWIISTDYTHYSVTYGCDVINETGGCDAAHAALWSRRPLLSDVWKNKTHQVFSVICINWTSLNDTIHNHGLLLSFPQQKCD